MFFKVFQGVYRHLSLKPRAMLSVGALTTLIAERKPGLMGIGDSTASSEAAVGLVLGDYTRIHTYIRTYLHAHLNTHLQ